MNPLGKAVLIIAGVVCAAAGITYGVKKVKKSNRQLRRLKEKNRATEKELDRRIQALGQGIDSLGSSLKQLAAEEQLLLEEGKALGLDLKVVN